MRVTIGTTRAFPMQKYLIFSGIPVAVQLSGNPFNLSHSMGVSVLSFPVTQSIITLDDLLTSDSDVSMVRDGASRGSGQRTIPSEK